MAQRIEWSDGYALGINEIDLQHKKLLAVANDLYDIATGERDQYALNMAKVLKSLTDYTVYHFSNEEQFMRRYGYPTADFHKVQHDNFVNEITSQIKLLAADNPEQGIKLYDFLTVWILNHIAKSDKTWASYVKPLM